MLLGSIYSLLYMVPALYCDRSFVCVSSHSLIYLPVSFGATDLLILIYSKSEAKMAILFLQE